MPYFYHASPCSWYPVSEKGVGFTNGLKLESLPANKIISDEVQSMLDWEAQFGRSVRQISERQVTTMAKTVTSP